MKNQKYLIIIIILIISSCRIFGPKKQIICDCCGQTYTNIDSAIMCIKENPYTKSSADPRLFLLAFVKNEVKKNQELGWNIINDQEIINEAKRKYLLITLDLNNFKIAENDDAASWNWYINNNKADILFIISDEYLNAWGAWTFNDSKDFILDRLGVGSGP